MWKRAILVVGLIALSGCSNDPAAPLDSFQPEVTNDTDSFQLQATNVTDVGTTIQYMWTNTGGQAVIDHSTTTAAGVASLVITDASGATVYDHSLSPSLNEDSGSGTAGDWTITVVLSEYSGTLNFRVQKK